jgi:Arc/MetJ-type ribon-helix-helix transcriptional regulator
MASRAISVRLDEASERALAELTRSGADQSEAVRGAIVEAAARQRHSALAGEAAALAADADDRAEVAEVAALMDSLRAAG